MNVKLPLAGISREWNGFGVEVFVDCIDGRYECSTVQVSRRPGGPEITCEALRMLPVVRFIREFVELADPLVVPSFDPGAEDRLERVADLYGVARKRRVPPKRLIAQAFGRSEQTASRWIGQARKAGLIPAVES